MKNRKGFTLVELLAVIAILAILVIIALPNVIEMFNNAKKQVFLTEAQTVSSASEKKFLSDSISGKSKNIYCKSKTDEINPLELTGGKKYYYVELGSNGETKKLIVWDDQRYIKYVSSGTKDISDLTVDEVVNRDNISFTCDNILVEIGDEEPIVPLDKNVSDLSNTKWILDNNYKFSNTSVVLEDGTVSEANKLVDLKEANINFISNGKNFIGISSLHLPYNEPGIKLDVERLGYKITFTESSSNMDYPFGNLIESNNGIIIYGKANNEGVYVPYYQKEGWIDDKYKTVEITGGSDVKSTHVINWFKTHGIRIK